MSNLPEFWSSTGPVQFGFVRASGAGNCEMSTFVPIEARGGMMLHPGPGPFAAGPGPFPACVGLSSSCSFLSAANAPAHRSVTTAVAAIMATLACFDTLLIHALHVDVRSSRTFVRLIAELPDRI